MHPPPVRCPPYARRSSAIRPSCGGPARDRSQPSARHTSRALPSGVPPAPRCWGSYRLGLAQELHWWPHPPNYVAKNQNDAWKSEALPAPGHITELATLCTGLFEPAHPDGSSRQEDGDMGVGLCVPAMRRLTIRWSVGPFPPRALPRFPGSMGRSDFPAPAHRHSGLPCADAPDPRAGPMVGSPGFRALPVPACRRLRPRWTRVRSRLGERSLVPSPS